MQIIRVPMVVDGQTLELAEGNTLRIKALGVGTAHLAANAATAAKVGADVATQAELDVVSAALAAHDALGVSAAHGEVAVADMSTAAKTRIARCRPTALGANYAFAQPVGSNRYFDPFGEGNSGADTYNLGARRLRAAITVLSAPTVYISGHAGGNGVITLMVDGNPTDIVVTVNGNGAKTAAGTFPLAVAAGSTIAWRSQQSAADAYSMEEFEMPYLEA